MKLMTAQGTYSKYSWSDYIKCCQYVFIIMWFSLQKRKTLPFIYWQCVTLLNSTWYKIFIQNGANIFYTNFSLFKSDEGRWKASNAANCKQDGVFFNEYSPWLKPRCVRPDHHASRWSLLTSKYLSLKIMALHALIVSLILLFSLRCLS